MKSPSATLGGQAAVAIACAAGFLRHLAPWPDGDDVVVASAGALAAVVWFFGIGLTRYLVTAPATDYFFFKLSTNAMIRKISSRVYRAPSGCIAPVPPP